jgi:Uma2 family endonuclease
VAVRRRDPVCGAVMRAEHAATAIVRRVPLPTVGGAEQDMAMSATRHSAEYLASQRWTADRVRHELIDEAHPSPRYEFIDGELLVSPSPEYLHQRIVAELLVALYAYVKAHGVGVALTSPSDVAVAPNTVAQPDVFVVAPAEVARLGFTRGHQPIRQLLLAIEVLSPPSVRTDRLTKRRFYARAGVPEYWVVDPERRVVERTVAGDERVLLEDGRLVWAPAASGEPFHLDLRALFDETMGPGPEEADG